MQLSLQHVRVVSWWPLGHLVLSEFSKTSNWLLALKNWKILCQSLDLQLLWN